MDAPYLDTVLYDNFYELLKGRFGDSAEKSAIRYFAGDEIVSISYRELVRRVACVYFYLKEHLKDGAHIGILSENRYEYIVIWLAAVFDHVIVPLDKELDAESLAESGKAFDIDFLFCTEKTMKAAEGAFGCELSCIDRSFSAIIENGDPVERFFGSVEHTDAERFAVLASTSGTDGRMKGVMLCQRNVIMNIRGTLENNVLKDPTLAFLPMNHSYGFHPCILATLYNGTTLCLNTELKHLARDLKAFDPYFFGAVPMVVEGLYDKILREVKRRGKERTFRRMIALSNGLRKLGIDLRHLFFGKFINPRLRLVVSGGAPLGAEAVKRFDELGITILNGYGLTECSPTVAVSRACQNVPGSAGFIMKHIEVKTAEDGELLVKGPCVMLGYYKDEASTKAVMRGEYLATGDLGHTEGKILFVTGRKKNLIILGNGKNVAPEYLEGKLGGLEAVRECLVVAAKGAGKEKIIRALIRLKEGADASELKEGIDGINRGLPPWMRIADSRILTEEFEKNGSGKILRSRYTDV
ncbi:MAG: AMP-binding protein [Lachnospiraceae bacterium]|nr:AMP-binding protein [Lachnospiraceae bacterium]